MTDKLSVTDKTTNNKVLSTLVLTLQDRKLVMPASLMVEITPLSDLIIEAHQHGWLLGYKHWRNMRVPVVALENMAGGNLRKHSHLARIAILKRTSDNRDLPYWGVLIQGNPEPLMLAETDIFATDEHLSEIEQSAVQVKGIAARIPDFACIEQRIAQIRSVH